LNFEQSIVIASLIVVYFLLACVVVWAALFPEGRAYFRQTIARLGLLWTGVTRSSSRASEQTRSKATYVSKYFSLRLQYLSNLVLNHRWFVLAGFLVLTIPPMGIVVFSSGTYLDGFKTDAVEINTQVASLLKGEQLVPPAPLPPEIFIAADALMLRNQLSQYTLPLLASASRNWQLLDPEYAQRLLLVFKIMREQHGYDMAILEGYRSPERQDMLSKIGVHVTGAKAFQSYHQYGLAADCAFLRDGKLVISEKDPWAMKGYTLYGEVAESLGLTWGGRWKMMDFGHVEWRKPGFVKKQGS
jgi:peptidoglycan LD-endopeptidase CwlK